jgi:hypothetical protein
MFFWNYSRENALTRCTISSVSNTTLKSTEQSNIAWISRFIYLPYLTVEWWGCASTLKLLYERGLALIEGSIAAILEAFIENVKAF